MSITQDVNRFNEKQYAEGVFLAMTGQAPVPEFRPHDVRAGYSAAMNGMSAQEKRFWYDYCVERMGYVDPLPHWSDRHDGGGIV